MYMYVTMCTCMCLYLAGAGGAWGGGETPGGSAEARGALQVLTGQGDVVGQAVSQTGVCHTARTALALRHRGEVTRQHRTRQGPTVHLPLLTRRVTERAHTHTQKYNHLMLLCCCSRCFVCVYMCCTTTSQRTIKVLKSKSSDCIGNY